jgi:hypothetical protein
MRGEKRGPVGVAQQDRTARSPPERPLPVEYVNHHESSRTDLNNLAHTLDALGQHDDAAAVRERIPTPPTDDRDAGASGS